mgnify:CR=1 FL=1
MPFIGPWEIALILLVVLILFGPKKLPELAKAVGDAMRQYRQATEGTLSSVATAGSSETQKTVSSETGVKNQEKTLIETAKRLGIKTEGKTAEEISDEIVEKSSRKSK